ncbi:MAG: hypothetical protein M1834_004528 [Cirrosporium novae-zelandiae]|nr:MAG: hypothetical protein M1834_004528 [Cirrosporium novae-zelandiae]
MVFLAQKHVSIPTKDLVSWMFDNAGMRYDWDKPIYIDAKNPTRSISAKQARSIIRKLVAGFRAAGLERGDCVCLHGFNDVNYPMVVLGVIAAGGVFTGTNPAYTQHELIHNIKIAKVKYLISEPEIFEPLLAAGKECHIPTENIWVFDNSGQQLPKGFCSWTTLMQHGEQDWVCFDDEEMSKNTTAARLFSSGTTGLPKAAMLSHHNLIAEHTLVVEIVPCPHERSRILCMPMFHAAIFPSAHTACLREGATGYVLRRFELEYFLASIEKYRISDLGIVPPIVIATIMSPITNKYSLRSVRAATCGAAPLGKEPQGRFEALLADGAPFTQVWGMTETSCIATRIAYPERDSTGSVGRFLPNLDAKLIDDDGKDITGYDVQGEICLRGPTVTNGYFENPKANTDSFDSEGFFKTGDIGFCDGKSKLWYIIDRKKELIKVRGFQVAPPEIEAILLSHPHIVDAAVIGVQFDRHETEFPRAYVVRRPSPEGAKLTEEEVINYTRSRLASFKRLTGGVRFMEAIPKNASGKILKRILREEAKLDLLRPSL